MAAVYGEHCARIGVASKQEQESITREHTDALKQAMDHARAEPIWQTNNTQSPEWAKIERCYSHEQVDTGVEESTLRRIGLHLTTVPEDFHIHPMLARILGRKQAAFTERSTVDWSFAEALAFGSLLLEGTPMRLSGEDCVRGTFAQRHLTWWDAESEHPRPYTPLRTLAGDQALSGSINRNRKNWLKKPFDELLGPLMTR